MLTRIIYEALSMKDVFKEMPRDQDFLSTIEEWKEETHCKLQCKAEVERLEIEEKGKAKMQEERKEKEREKGETPLSSQRLKIPHSTIRVGLGQTKFQ